jgi:cytidylate kinase
MYRAAALFALRNGIPYSEISQSDNIIIDLKTTPDGQRVFLNGGDVTGEIRGPEATRGSSAIAVYPAVRAMVTSRAREIASGGNVVMDGRDIGTAVLPDAQLKVYLDAPVDIRAARRYKELAEKGSHMDFEAVKNDVISRDYNDTSREADPLRKADDAVIIDVGRITADEAVEAILELIKKRGGLQNVVL